MTIERFGRPIAVTVSGSFRRHLVAIHEAVESARAFGATVLSPADPRVVDSFGEFVFVSSDLRRSIKGVQNRHLEAIAQSDFLWLVCPDGYVGQSASMEVGYATAAGIPIYSDVAPSDWTIRQYVTPVGTLDIACALARGIDVAPTDITTLLLNPTESLERVRRELETVEGALRDRTPATTDAVEAPVRRIRRILRVPTKI
jgi:hypothetical protein